MISAMSFQTQTQYPGFYLMIWIPVATGIQMGQYQESEDLGLNVGSTTYQMIEDKLT